MNIPISCVMSSSMWTSCILKCYSIRESHMRYLQSIFGLIIFCVWHVFIFLLIWIFIFVNCLFITYGKSILVWIFHSITCYRKCILKLRFVYREFKTNETSNITWKTEIAFELCIIQYPEYKIYFKWNTLNFIHGKKSPKFWMNVWEY